MLVFSAFPAAMWRLLKNIAFVFLCLSLMVDISTMVGYTTFAPKYLETQFHLNPGMANLITGKYSTIVLVPNFYPHNYISIQS